MVQPVIKVTHLFKNYLTGDFNTAALNDVSLTIKAGEFVAIMGPSGSGKSTLMHILGGLDVGTSGLYYLEGQDLSQMSDDVLAEIRNRKIGFVFQAYNLLPRTSALDNVMLPMQYAGIPEAEQLLHAKKYLTLVGLADRLYHPPNKLSGGQQQRVAIARALIMNPALILADEPTGNIASDQAEAIMAIFQTLNEKEGHTVVIITHELEIAEHASRIIQLKDGRIIKDSRTHQVRHAKL